MLGRLRSLVNDMTNTEKWIIMYLDKKDWTSPTEIGNAYGKEKKGINSSGYHSSWGSPRCLKLTEMGLLQRNKKGHYRLAI